MRFLERRCKSLPHEEWRRWMKERAPGVAIGRELGRDAAAATRDLGEPSPSPPHRLPIPRRPAATGHRITHGGTIQKRGSFSNFPIKTPPASRQSTNTGSSSNQQLNHAPLPLPSPPASAELGLEAAMQPDAGALDRGLQRLLRCRTRFRRDVSHDGVSFASLYMHVAP